MTEEIQNIINMATPVVVEKEMVQDGTNANYRALKVDWVALGKVVTETRNYHNSVSSPGWASYSSNYSIKEVQSGS